MRRSGLFRGRSRKLSPDRTIGRARTTLLPWPENGNPVRLYLLWQWFNLSDSAAEDALDESQALRMGELFRESLN